jgi:hypothetical protein
VVVGNKTELMKTSERMETGNFLKEEMRKRSRVYQRPGEREILRN